MIQVSNDGAGPRWGCGDDEEWSNSAYILAETPHGGPRPKSGFHLPAIHLFSVCKRLRGLPGTGPWMDGRDSPRSCWVQTLCT